MTDYSKYEIGDIVGSLRFELHKTDNDEDEALPVMIKMDIDGDVTFDVGLMLMMNGIANIIAQAISDMADSTGGDDKWNALSDEEQGKRVHEIRDFVMDEFDEGCSGVLSRMNYLKTTVDREGFGVLGAILETIDSNKAVQDVEDILKEANKKYDNDES